MIRLTATEYSWRCSSRLTGACSFDVILFFLLVFGLPQYKTSNASFIFSLRNPNNLPPFKCSIIRGRNERAIGCHPSDGAIFGGDNDLFIANNANSNQGSYSNLGHTYQPPAGYQYGTPQTQSLLAGSRNFTPTEIEVFYWNTCHNIRRKPSTPILNTLAKIKVRTNCKFSCQNIEIRKIIGWVYRRTVHWSFQYNFVNPFSKSNLEES